MRGPPPTPASIRTLRGNPGQRRLPVEPEPVREAECRPPPTFLGEYARAEWSAVAPVLHRLGLLTVVDVTALAAYCAAVAHWRTAEECLARQAEGDEEATGGLIVKTKDGNPRRNPLIRVASDAAAD